MNLVEILLDLKILADKCYVSRLVRVLGRRSETELTISDSGKKDLSPTARVVGSASGWSGSGWIYQVD